MRPIAIAGALLLLSACGGNEDGNITGNGGSTAASGAGGEGAGGQGMGGAAGGATVSSSSAGGTGGAGGFPWEGAIDPNGGSSSSRLTAKPLGSTSAAQGFYEYLPSGYPGNVSWPLLVALHGVGENGNGTSQLVDILVTGIPKLVNTDAWPIERPFVVLMPQHAGGGCPSAVEIQSFIAWGLANYDIDTRYVYLTGLSCGAIGSWSYLAQNLDSQIAALVPIAGDGKGAWNNQGCELARVAIWAFHGDADGTVNVSGTNVPMDGLAGCPAPALETKKTIYPGVGHNSWDRTYDLSEGHDIYTWMLGFTHAP
jgi:hypothetical protein